MKQNDSTIGAQPKNILKKKYQTFFSVLMLIFCVASSQFSNAQTAPTTAPPTPPARNTSDVISIYGGGDNNNTYTEVAGVNYNPNWGQATVESEVSIAGNKVLKYANFNYQGTDFGHDVDISSMQYLHFDIWTDNQSPRVFIITRATTFPTEIPNPITNQPGSWKSVDLAINSSTMLTDLANTYQFKFDGGNGGTIYLDNIYFYKVPTGTDANLSDLKVAGKTVSGFSASTTSYTVTVPYGTTTVPTVTVTTTDAAATAVITPASTISETTTIMVTSQDGSVTKTYMVGFQEGVVNTACAGINLVEAIDGAFSTGYDYNFSTANGTDVTVSFKFLDTDKTGLVAYVFKTDSDGANWSENGPNYPDASNSFSRTFMGLTTGTTYRFAAKFEFTGGLAVTKYFNYTVGDNCGSLGIDDAQLSDNSIKLYPNPANKGIVTIEAGELKVSKVEVYSILGAKVLETSKTAISTSNLQAGIYFVKIYSEGKSITKKLIVN